MARQLRIQYKGALYHVMARGNNGERTFFNPDDYTKFRSYLFRAREKFGCLIHAYALMPNHYHLLLETPLGNLSRIMHFVNSSYTTHINSTYERYGHLFQGRYKSILVEKDSYLLQVSRYIHLNPVAAKIAKSPEDYPYSSYRHYLGIHKDPLIYSDSTLKMLDENRVDARNQYKTFVESAQHEDELYPQNFILGSRAFIKNTHGHLRHQEEAGAVIPTPASSESILQSICQYFETNSEQLLVGAFQTPRRIALYLLKSLTDLTNEEIGELMGGISKSAVSKACNRLSKEMCGKPELKSQVEKITEQALAERN